MMRFFGSLLLAMMKFLSRESPQHLHHIVFQVTSKKISLQQIYTMSSCVQSCLQTIALENMEPCLIIFFLFHLNYNLTCHRHYMKQYTLFVLKLLSYLENIFVTKNNNLGNRGTIPV
jgi:hypothetical protein